MKDEDEENIIPNEDESDEGLNESANEEGFEDIKTSGGNHFYEND